MEAMGCAMMASDEFSAEEQQHGAELVNAGKTVGDWALQTASKMARVSDSQPHLAWLAA